MSESKQRQVWCTYCWTRFQVGLDRLNSKAGINCPWCNERGEVVGHIVRGMIFCNDCHDFGCDASVCRCTCHKEKIGV